MPASCSCSLGLPLRSWHQWFCAIPVSSPLCRSPCVIPWVWLSTWPCVLLTQSCPTLCYPLDCSLPGSSIHGISQARIPEWAAISFSRDWTSISRVSCITGGFFTCRTMGDYPGTLVSKDWCVLPRSQLLLPSALHRPPSRCRLSGPHWFDITGSSSSRPPLHWLLWTFYLSYFLVLCFVAQSCLALCDPWTVASQAPLSMGILQARILEWVAMPSPRVSSQPRDRTQVSCIAGRFFKLSYQGRPHFLNLSLFLFCCPASPF